MNQDFIYYVDLGNGYYTLRVSRALITESQSYLERSERVKRLLQINRLEKGQNITLIVLFINRYKMGLTALHTTPTVRDVCAFDFLFEFSGSLFASHVFLEDS